MVPSETVRTSRMRVRREAVVQINCQGSRPESAFQEKRTTAPPRGGASPEEPSEGTTVGGRGQNSEPGSKQKKLSPPPRKDSPGDPEIQSNNITNNPQLKKGSAQSNNRVAQ